MKIQIIKILMENSERRGQIRILVKKIEYD